MALGCVWSHGAFFLSFSSGAHLYLPDSLFKANDFSDDELIILIILRLIISILCNKKLIIISNNSLEIIRTINFIAKRYHYLEYFICNFTIMIILLFKYLIKTFFFICNIFLL